MKKRIIIGLAVSALLLLLHAGSAFAQQSPAPTASPPAATSAPVDVESTAAEEDSESKPWIRLVWLVPLAASVGAASVFGRRLLVEREWLDAA